MSDVSLSGVKTFRNKPPTDTGTLKMDGRGTFSRTSSSGLNALRLNGEFCDAVIKVEDVNFQIHKVILSQCSPYFLTLFRRWSTPYQKVFHIPGLSPDMMQLIIDFAYTGSVTVTEDNAQELLQAADQFNVMDIVQTCCNFLGEKLCPQNCIGIFQLTNIYFSAELQRKAYCYIVDHFEEVVFCDEFLQLSVQQLTAILSRDDINVRYESTVYEAIIRWISHLPEQRKVHIAVLLSQVRLGLLSMDYLKGNVVSNRIVKSNTVCQPMLTEAVETITTITENGCCVFDLYSHFARPRLPNAILLAIGGWCGSDPSQIIEAYNVFADNWISVTNHLEHPRAYHGTAFLNGNLYCIGGFDRFVHFNSVRRYDLITKTWHEVASMYHRRCYVSVTVLHGCIYAMGGYDGHIRLNTAECYRPETNQWSLIAPMNEPRSDSSSTTLHNKIYICGGFNGAECLQTAECYSPKTNQWTDIAPMSCPRSGIGIVAYADHVYAVGGFNGNIRLRSAEAYNPQTNTWHEVPPMLTPRSNFGIEVIDDRLFVVGGFNGYMTCTNVESYNVAANEWSVAYNMEINRSALSCCVVSRLPNLTEYLVPRHAMMMDLENASVYSGHSD